MNFDIDKVRMGIQNNQLTALLCAVLDSLGGSHTLTPEQATRVHEGRELKLEERPDGSLTVSLTVSLKGESAH